MTNAQLPPNLQEALQASRDGDPEAAIRLLQQAMREAPTDPLPHFLLAAELAQGGQMAEAEAAYANTVLLAPAFETARFQLGLLQFTSGRASIAMLSWRPLLELPDTNPFRHFVQGFAALAADNFDEAVQCFRRGMTLNHDNAPLNADMQMMIDRIEPLRSSAAATAEPQAAAEPSDNNDDTAQSHHVLLSNYRQDGPVH
jgi:Flp pilus assembly protein TadD